jgi:hypothetical protein
MTFNAHPAILRTLIGTLGALLFASVCLGTAVGPAQAISAAPSISTLSA